MKKIVSLTLALLLCLGMTLTASAAAVTGDFVPSVGYKEKPDVVLAEFVHKDGTREDITDCIIITSIEEAKAKSTDITQDERDLLLKKYEDLKNGEKLPLDYDYVILQLLDVNFKYQACRLPAEHGDKPVKHEGPDFHVEITFDLGVGADTVIDVMKFYENGWEAPASVTSNGDGTVTVVYEDHFCPNAFAVKQGVGTGAPQTGDDNGSRLVVWGSVFGACVLGLIAVVIVFARKRKHA